MADSRPIGVFDTGIGGLTVVKELQKILPGEDIVYFGDSANCPYGNKPAEEIRFLSKKILHHLEKCSVKAIAIACNGISTQAELLRGEVAVPVIDIISAASERVVQLGLRQIGLIAAEITVKTGKYDELIRGFDPSLEVIPKGSPLLAGLVDRGDFDKKAIDAEIRLQIDNILARAPVSHIMLACTHYPIVEDRFAACYPNITWFNPGIAQADAVKALLAEKNLLNPNKRGKFTLTTSGDPAVYAAIAKRLGLFEPDSLKKIVL